MAASENNIIPLRGNHGGARKGAGRKPGSKTKNEGRFVYILHEVEHPSICKLGIAANPLARLATHQVGTWRRLKYAAIVTFECKEAAMEVEKFVHRQIGPLHVSGEWFEVDAPKMLDLLIASAESMGLKHSEFDPSHLKRLQD